MHGHPGKGSGGAAFAGDSVIGELVGMTRVLESADRDYWNELATVLGWTLYEWKDREHAQFFIGPNTLHNTPLETVTGKMRDDILKALGTVSVTPNVTSETIRRQGIFEKDL